MKRFAIFTRTFLIVVSQSRNKYWNVSSVSSQPVLYLLYIYFIDRQIDRQIDIDIDIVLQLYMYSFQWLSLIMNILFEVKLNRKLHISAKSRQLFLQNAPPQVFDRVLNMLLINLLSQHNTFQHKSHIAQHRNDFASMISFVTEISFSFQF